VGQRTEEEGKKLRDHNDAELPPNWHATSTNEAKKRMSILRLELRSLVLTASASEMHHL